MIYYVSNTGSDSNDGSELSPFLTIAYAISIASNSDTITLQNAITISSTLIINKELTISNGEIIKSNFGVAVQISASNVTITNCIIGMPSADILNAVINIDRGSSGEVAPNNYYNINITNNTIKLSKYGIIVNGTNIIITGNSFIRNTGVTQSLSCLLVYQINNLTFSNNTITDALRMARIIYFTSSGTAGSTFLNIVNFKTGLITIENNICECISQITALVFFIQDSFIPGGVLDFVVSNNQLNNSFIQTKLFVPYVSNPNDLDIYSSVNVYDNFQFLTTRGAVLIDSAVPITLTNIDRPIFHTYNNTTTEPFLLYAFNSGNINFSQNTTNILPPDIYLSSAVNLINPAAGGDPHVIDIYGRKTTLPNDWTIIRLYESDSHIVTAKAEFIGNWLLTHPLHKIVDNRLTTVDLNTDFYITNYTYFTNVVIHSKITNTFLKIDTIEGHIISDNSDILYTKSNKPLFAISHNYYYQQRNAVSFEIDLEKDVLEIVVDNFYDDINSIILKPKSSPINKIGELIYHDEQNKLL